jgi:hypothetical protein
MSSQLRMAGMHLAESAEWYSPRAFTEAAHEVMGGIDLDPASSAIANTVVRAERFYTETDDGLTKPWEGRIWLNPPTPPRAWWERLVATYTHEAGVGVYLSYSIEPLASSQTWTPMLPMLACSLCIPVKRIRFLSTAPDAAARLRKELATRAEKKNKGSTKGEREWLAELDAMAPDALVEGDAPPHASAIVGVGVDPEKFERAYRHLGMVKR